MNQLYAGEIFRGKRPSMGRRVVLNRSLNEVGALHTAMTWPRGKSVLAGADSCFQMTASVWGEVEYIGGDRDEVRNLAAELKGPGRSQKRQEKGDQL